MVSVIVYLCTSCIVVVSAISIGSVVVFSSDFTVGVGSLLQFGESLHRGVFGSCFFFLVIRVISWETVIGVLSLISCLHFLSACRYMR